VRKLGSVIFWTSAVLAIAILAAGLHLAFVDFTDGLSYDIALMVIALAAAIMFVGFMAKRIFGNNS
jgi:hypothetical protein